MLLSMIITSSLLSLELRTISGSDQNSLYVGCRFKASEKVHEKCLPGGDAQASTGATGVEVSEVSESSRSRLEAPVIVVEEHCPVTRASRSTSRIFDLEIQVVICI